MNPRGASVWWLWPAAPLLGLTAASLIVANGIDGDFYRRAWRTTKTLDDDTMMIMLGVVVAVVAGTVIAAMMERSRSYRFGSAWPAMPADAVEVLRRIYPWLIGMTLFGYGLWIGLGILRGLSFEDLSTVLTTQDNFRLPVKAKLETVPGLTTLTQVAIPAAIVGVLLDFRRPNVWVRRAYRLTIVLALIRAFMLAERLAVAEIIVPIIVLRATHLGYRLTDRRRMLVALAPVFGVVLLVGGFAASEYSRSWNWYASRTDVGFVSFASERLAGYYATSHNNGALMLNRGRTVTDLPYNTSLFVWQIPPGSQLAGDLNDDVEDEKRRVLTSYGNPEFNSSSGLAGILTDYGTVGGIGIAFLIGIVLGSLHLSFLHGRVLGLLLYPMAFTGLLELPRYLYWFQGRATPAIGVAVLVAALVARSRSRRSSPAAMIDLSSLGPVIR